MDERTECRKVQDRLIARIERTWNEHNVDTWRLGNTYVGAPAYPTVADARKMIYPQFLDHFREMIRGDLCVGYGDEVYVPEF